MLALFAALVLVLLPAIADGAPLPDGRGSKAAAPLDAPEAVLRGCDGCECCAQLRSALDQVWARLQRIESRTSRLEYSAAPAPAPDQPHWEVQPPPPPPAAGPIITYIVGVVAAIASTLITVMLTGRRGGGGCKYASGGVALLMALGLATSSPAAETRLPASGWIAAERSLVPVQRDPFKQLEDRDGSYKLLQPFSAAAVDQVPGIHSSTPQVQYLGLEDVAWRWTQPAPWHACALRLQTADGSVGSGVYMQLAPNLGGVLTAKHVVSDSRGVNQVTGRWIDGAQQRFSAILPDRSGADLAFLVMASPRSDVPPLHWTDRPPGEGEYLEAMGYGSGATTLRHYAMVYEGDAYQGRDRSDGQAMHGDSGGGILTLDSLGRVAVCSVVTNGEGQGYQSRGGRYYQSMLFPSPTVVHDFLCRVVGSQGQGSQGRGTGDAGRGGVVTLELDASQAQLSQVQCPPGGCPEWYSEPQRSQDSGRQYLPRDEPIFPESSPYQIGPQPPQQGWGQQRQDNGGCGPQGCPPPPGGWGQHAPQQQPRYAAPSAPGSPLILVGCLLAVGGVVGVLWFISQD